MKHVFISYVNEGEFMRAIKNYTKAIKLDPGCVLAYYNRGIHELRL